MWERLGSGEYVEISDEELASRHDAMLDEIYGTVQIAEGTWNTSVALRNLDYTAYRDSFLTWVDEVMENGDLVEDKPTTYQHIIFMQDDDFDEALRMSQSELWFDNWCEGVAGADFDRGALITYLLDWDFGEGDISLEPEEGVEVEHDGELYNLTLDLRYGYCGLERVTK